MDEQKEDKMPNLDPWYNTPNMDSNVMEYLSIALIGACDDDCVFCYVDGSRPGGWDFDELKGVLTQAKDLGMSKIQLSGGEPSLYKRLRETIEFLSEQGTSILLVTNGSQVNADMAQFLHDHNVVVGISLETIDEKVSDFLTNRPGSHKRKLRVIDNLIEVGYTKDLPLNIIMKTMTHNFPTYMDTWKWALEKGIQPILDRAIPGVRLPQEWVISGEQLRYLLDEIGELQGVYHRIPFVNNEGCNRLSCGTHIELNGDVYPCGGIPLVMGNVHKKPLREIWENSDVANLCRKLGSQIYGSCGVCEEKAECYGCRAVPYAVFGDIKAPDPFCWKYDPTIK